jgi:hypothetical protein
VFFYDEQGALKALPASWTDAGQLDPFVSLADGRAHFRPADLLELAALAARIRNTCSANDWEGDVR